MPLDLRGGQVVTPEMLEEEHVKAPLAEGGPRQLLMGAGHNREKRVVLTTKREDKMWKSLVTCDINPACHVDHVFDLNTYPWPFADEEFQEIHAYEVLEHLGQQGDYKSFFAFFTELYRVMEPDGYFMFTCPSWKSEAAWADPGHTRVLTPITLAFLDQSQYKRQIDECKGWMTDYRSIYKANFVPVNFKLEESGPTAGMFWAILQKK